MGCGSSTTSKTTDSVSKTSGGKSGGVVHGYFGGIRGGPRANGTRFLLNYCKVQYTDKLFSMANGMKEWKDYKASGAIPLPDLPYLTDGDVKITQTLAI